MGGPLAGRDRWWCVVSGREGTPTARYLLVCHSCQDAWEPDVTDPVLLSAGETGCRRCGGWTWLGEITEPAAHAAVEQLGAGGDAHVRTRGAR